MTIQLISSDLVSIFSKNNFTGVHSVILLEDDFLNYCVGQLLRDETWHTYVPPFRILTSSNASQNETTFNGSKGQYIESWCQGIEMPTFGILHKILVVKMLTCLVFSSWAAICTHRRKISRGKNPFLRDHSKKRQTDRQKTMISDDFH